MADNEDYSADFTPDAHAASHKSGGSDELNISGLISADHASRHERGGDDEVDVSGLTGVGHRYVHRADASGADWTHSTLTDDGAWHELDFSSIVDAGAVLVHITVEILGDSTNKKMQWRKKGYTGDKTENRLETQVANVNIWGEHDVPLVGGVAEYTLNSVVTSNVRVLGWWV